MTKAVMRKWPVTISCQFDFWLFQPGARCLWSGLHWMKTVIRNYQMHSWRYSLLMPERPTEIIAIWNTYGAYDKVRTDNMSRTINISADLSWFSIWQSTLFKGGIQKRDELWNMRLLLNVLRHAIRSTVWDRWHIGREVRRIIVPAWYGGTLKQAMT